MNETRKPRVCALMFHELWVLVIPHYGVENCVTFCIYVFNFVLYQQGIFFLPLSSALLQNEEATHRNAYYYLYQ